MMESRFIQFDGIVNARDIGGLSVSDGRTVKSGVFFRTGSLANASEEDLKWISDAGIKLIFDFRCDFETMHSPDKEVRGVRRHNPQVVNTNGNLFKLLFQDGTSQMPKEQVIVNFVFSPAAKMLTDGFYTSYVTDPDAQSAYASMFRTIIDNGCPPMLAHCSQGKDRTGLASAFFLAALGAARETIRDEFDLSNVYYEDDVRKVWDIVSKEPEAGDEHRQIVQGIFGANTSWFEDAMDLIDETYGSISNYLSSCLLLTENDISILRNAYLI